MWVPQLCAALSDITDWQTKGATLRYFSADTIKAVEDMFIARWIDTPPLQVGLKKPAHFLAFMLDPYTTPLKEALPEGWENDCCTALSQFLKEMELEEAMNELKSLLMRRGSWGDVIRRKQKLIEPPADMEFDSKVERIIWQQKNMKQTVDDCQLPGLRQFPKLAPIAVKLAVVAVQSADVERVCKAHKVIHTTARNRLYTKTVQLLLYTYINLRLLNKYTAEMGDFLAESLSNCNDEENLPAGERTETNEPEAEVENMTIGIIEALGLAFYVREIPWFSLAYKLNIGPVCPFFMRSSNSQPWLSLKGPDAKHTQITCRSLPV